MQLMSENFPSHFFFDFIAIATLSPPEEQLQPLLVVVVHSVSFSHFK
tara:strand:- start:217 stop:357 length:141 start_codon:yes stop_codon:yes gene_type:complete